MKVPLQIALITAAFAAIYPIVRSLPDAKCAFLHYDQVEGSDSAELCLDDQGSAVFYDLERLRFPVEFRVIGAKSDDGKEQPTSYTVGEAAEIRFTLKTELGRPIRYEELAIVHTERLHMFVIDASLGDYHHVHPLPGDEPGEYVFNFTPRRAGSYTLYGEAVPQASKSVFIAKAEIVVDPAKGEGTLPPSTPPVPEHLQFELETLGGLTIVNYPNDLVIRVTSPADAPAQFEETMGAYCHLAAFDETGKGFAHLHPLDEGVGVGSGEASFSFVLNTTMPGKYKLWAQFRIAGEETFVPFELVVD